MPPVTTEYHHALILLDGLGDRPHPDTGGMSPIEAARTPRLDRMVGRGTMGQIEVVGPGIAPESDAGVLAILGYDPATESPGRGVLEALGVGIPLAPEDVALRLNFATTDGAGTVLDSRAGRSLTTEEAKDLARDLSAGDLLSSEAIHAEVRATVGHRGVLWMHPTDDRALSPEVSNSDPFYDRVGGLGEARAHPDPRIRPVEALVSTEAARRTAQALNLFLARSDPILAGHRVNARRALSGRPVANGLLLRNAGARPDRFPSFVARHGLAGAAVTEMPVERGIARLLGFDDLFVGPMGPDRPAGYASRARQTRRALETHPFVYVHLKGPDEPGHDGDAVRKKEIVEAIDEWFFGPFLEGLDWSAVRVAVTADHATPCSLKAHAADPVPLLLAGAGIAAASPGGSSTDSKFSERTAAAGAIGTRRGSDVLPLLFGSTLTPQ